MQNVANLAQMQALQTLYKTLQSLAIICKTLNNNLRTTLEITVATICNTWKDLEVAMWAGTLIQLTVCVGKEQAYRTMQRDEQLSTDNLQLKKC